MIFNIENRTNPTFLSANHSLVMLGSHFRKRTRILSNVLRNVYHSRVILQYSTLPRKKQAVRSIWIHYCLAQRYFRFNLFNCIFYHFLHSPSLLFSFSRSIIIIHISFIWDTRDLNRCRWKRKISRICEVLLIVWCPIFDKKQTFFSDNEGQ